MAALLLEFVLTLLRVPRPTRHVVQTSEARKLATRTRVVVIFSGSWLDSHRQNNCVKIVIVLSIRAPFFSPHAPIFSPHSAPVAYITSTRMYRGITNNKPPYYYCTAVRRCYVSVDIIILIVVWTDHSITSAAFWFRILFCSRPVDAQFLAFITGITQELWDSSLHHHLQEVHHWVNLGCGPGIVHTVLYVVFTSLVFHHILLVFTSPRAARPPVWLTAL